jgi:CMP-N,N'-diacetyllegionaminic acid synthase
MSNKTVLWAIIPARSGSKGLKDKNITPFLGKPLLSHSINFAKKLKFIDKIILSTDSKKYKKIGLRNGAEVPFLRSKKASNSNSMEEDVLEDIRKKLKKSRKQFPDYILWLRPTCPLRDLKLYNKAYQKFKKLKKSICVVSRTDPRVFTSKNDKLIPLNKNFKNRSMVRRQDCEPAFKIFYGEFFKFPKNYNKMFLGKKIYFVEQDNLCNIDIDTKDQMQINEKIIKLNKKIYAKFLHTS